MLIKYPFIFAHRGASSLAPENTLAAFQKALSLGVDGLEFEVQMTKDDVLVVFHDESVERTTNGKGLLRNYTLDELRSFDAGAWFSSKFKGEKIPTLAEVFQGLNGAKTLLNIEIKTNLFPYLDIERRVIKLLKVYGLIKRTLLSSANHLTLIRCQGIAPELKTGLLYGVGLNKPWLEAADLGVEFLIIASKKVSPRLVKECKARKLEVIAYGVKSKKEYKQLYDLGVNGVISDNLYCAAHGCKQTE